MCKQNFLLILSCFSIVFLTQRPVLAQKQFKGLPDDLNVSKIIFLKHDSTEVEPEKPRGQGQDEKIRHALKKNHNTNVAGSNLQLRTAAKEYPFEYVITSRENVLAYKELGYKYVLDFKPFVDIRQGIRHSTTKVTVYFPLYIYDLTTTDTYIIDNVSENFVYYYTGLMKKALIKQVKRKYKLK
ncbi:hypothetical protein SanaruYs_04450 [Chryseotalea sanaruensis]|uniref:Uncharacterized protein n=1 Tax=Chryseotalea sanaruensis TaxID=2482724 RepID=A0A401U5V5_9BACT|nr:hypothetical protein [Chryseotalea sanaruensis]GCC50230.1 hypothetical protein SanaruYs_04450 [Chryseotalea sanaruensis]